jgi:hypothetical protein
LIIEASPPLGDILTKYITCSLPDEFTFRGHEKFIQHVAMLTSLTRAKYGETHLY